MSAGAASAAAVVTIHSFGPNGGASCSGSGCGVVLAAALILWFTIIVGITLAFYVSDKKEKRDAGKGEGTSN